MFQCGTYTRGNKLINIACQSTTKTTNPEDGIRKKQAGLPTKDIAQLAVQWLERSQSQEVRRRNPARQVERFQVTSNLTVAGHDDCLVRRRKENLHRRISRGCSEDWERSIQDMNTTGRARTPNDMAGTMYLSCFWASGNGSLACSSAD